jgi:hypothetical protein
MLPLDLVTVTSPNLAPAAIGCINEATTMNTKIDQQAAPQCTCGECKCSNCRCNA